MSRPNILWICSDQQRYDTLGCYGNGFVRTPNIDRLAAQGVVFESAYSQSPVCTPSRASFLTGRYPRTTRDRQNGQGIPEDEILVTKMLRDAGYTCGLSGKLHLSPCHPTACAQMERHIDDGYTVFHWSHHSGGGWGDHNEYHMWLHGRGLEFETPRRRDCRFVHHGMNEEHHQTTWCVDRAVEFIQERSTSGHPWLFSVNMFDPHHSFDPPDSYLERYLDRLEDIPLPAYEEGELASKTVWQRIDHKGAYGGRGMGFDDMTERDHRIVRAAYWAMCDLIDVQVGRLMNVLEHTGQRENTIVIYTSDHGEMLGDHGIYLKGPYMYEPAIHVPLIMSYPRAWQSGVRSNALTELVDLPQTLLDAVGVPHNLGMQGVSLSGLLTGEEDASRHRDDVYCEFYNSNFEYDPKAYLTMVRTTDCKIVASHRGDVDTGELYDLRNDPTEIHNLWNEPSALHMKARMLKRLVDRMAWTADPLPIRESHW
jgi:arylsulfatase A-like enzyme